MVRAQACKEAAVRAKAAQDQAIDDGRLAAIVEASAAAALTLAADTARAADAAAATAAEQLQALQYHTEWCEDSESEAESAASTARTPRVYWGTKRVKTFEVEYLSARTPRRRGKGKGRPIAALEDMQPSSTPAA